MILYMSCCYPEYYYLYHVTVLQSWSEAPPLESEYDAFMGIAVDIDWYEGGRLRTNEILKQMEEGISPFAWQTQQIKQIY